MDRASDLFSWPEVTSLEESMVTPESYRQVHGPRLLDRSRVKAVAGAILTFSGGVFAAASSVLEQQMDKVAADPRLSLFKVDEERSIALACSGPGAPMAALSMEILASLGIQRIVALGNMGVIDARAIRECPVVPAFALSGVGVTRYYRPGLDCFHADPLLHQRLLGELGSPDGEGVYSTDAMFRQGRALVTRLRARGVVGVDMEMAAVLAMAGGPGAGMPALQVAGVLCPTDRLDRDGWEPRSETLPARQWMESLHRSVRAIVRVLEGEPLA